MKLKICRECGEVWDNDNKILSLECCNKISHNYNTQPLTNDEVEEAFVAINTYMGQTDAKGKLKLNGRELYVYSKILDKLISMKPTAVSKT